MTYEEYVELLRASGIEDCDRYVTAAQETFDGLTNGANARIAELEEQVDTVSRQLMETQAKNYTLMMAATGKVDNDPADETEKDNPSEEDKDVSSLFGK